MGDRHLSKPEIAAQIIRELQALGFKFKLVLADSLYGESGSKFIEVLHELKLPFVVAIGSNHAVWLPKEQRVRCNRWREFKRIFSDGTTQQRYIREIIFGKRRATQCKGNYKRPSNLTQKLNLVCNDSCSRNQISPSG